VASYNAAINIVVSGQQRLDYVLNSVKKLNAITAKLKPINLLAPGAGGGGDAIRVAKKQLDDFARAVVNFQPQGIQKQAKELSKTMAGAAAQASALTTALANVGLKSGGFKEQAAEVKNYALALDTAARNVARLNAIGQTVQRGARVQNIATRFNVSPEQVEQRLANMREAAAKRQAQLDEAKRRRDLQKLLLLKREEDFELRLARIRERNAQAEAKRKRQTAGVSDAIIGGAFPLLFGQGLGASLGGALGGGIGARVGGGKGGFGGSLLGTIVGQATIDFAINSALKLGKALEAPTTNIEQLIELLGIAGTGLKSNIRVLQELGLTSTASSLALAKLEATLGAEGFKNAEEFSKDGQNLANAFSRLQLAVANLANGALPGILDFLTNAIKLAANAGLPKGGSLGRVAGVASATTQKTAGQLRAENFIGPVPDVDLTLERAAQKAITQEKQRQITLAAAQKNLEESRLSLTRVDLAAEQGRIAVLQIQNDLTRKQLELSKETEATKRSLLDLDIKLLQQQKAQAEAAQRNAVIEAQRAVMRQLGGLMIEQTELENQLYVLRSESAKLLQGEAIGLASQLNNIEQRYQNEIDILAVRRDLERLGINEAEVLQEINTKYDGLTAVVKQRLKNETETLLQQQAQYNLTQLQIKQQRELANLETSGRFQLELQRIQSFQDPTGFGFFGDALLNQKLALEEYNVTLSNYDAQLLALEDRMAVPGLNPDVLLGLTQQSDALKDQIALYKEYQPAIIQARLEQEKFNTIFNATKTAVDSLADGLVGVVSGTMTAQEAFASFLRTIGEMLAEEGKKMIAQYIAIGIARIFAGFGGFSPLSNAQATSFNFNPGAMTGSLTPGGLFAEGGTFSQNGIVPYASGGVVSSPTLFKFADGGATRTGLMGEAGPEAIMPLKRGSDGSLGVQATGLREAMNQNRAAGGGTPVLNMSFQSTNIGGVEYVSRDQLEAAMAQTRRQASRDGAQRGMTMTLDRIQNSSSTRRRIGV